MGRKVDLSNLVDAAAVADMLKLAQRNSVTTYANRYEDFPTPVISGGHGGCRFWLRSEIVRWARSHHARAARR